MLASKGGPRRWARIAIGLATVGILLLFKWFLVATGRLPGWF